jgi:hypothetical protein
VAGEPVASRSHAAPDPARDRGAGRERQEHARAVPGRRARRGAARRRPRGRGGARFGLVECRADEAALRSRLEARARAAGLAPGAWLALARELDRRFEAVDELPEGEHAVVDARRGARAAAEEALAWLGASPAAD